MAQSITLQTSDSDIVSSDVLGRLSFAASSESSGSDAVLIGASIYAMAESNFTEISNATSIIFATASSESAIAKLKISSQGHFLPILDKTYDIGASGTKFRNIFAENGKFENISISNLSDPYEILYITDSSGNVSSTDLLKVDVANTEIDLGGDLIPTSNLAYDLGSSSYKFRDTYTDKVILNSGSAIPATTSNTVYNVSGELYYNNNVVALLPSGGVQGQILQKYSTTSNILEWIDNFATEVRVYVKNTTGSALTKGQAVYINGAQGDHPTIALAIADGESSSSKTLGLLKQNLAINEFGYVIAEGALDGIDTSAASAAGDLIYLSPTTAGGVVYGLANRPTAPNHMVFIGYVVVKQQNNGKVFIKVQNGFELDELHNVATNGTANGTFLQYNTASGLWIASSSGNFTTLQVNGTDVPTGTGINSFVTTWDGTNSIGSSKLYHYYYSLDDQGYLSINGSGISSNTLSMFTPNAGDTKLYMHSTYGGAYIVQAPNDPYNPGNLWWGISSVDPNGNTTAWIGSRGDNNALEKVSIYTKASGVIGNPIERFTVGVNALVINDTSNNFDVRIEGDTDANLFFTDASVDRVGIGTSSPSYKLDVVGTGNFSQNLLVNGIPVSVSGHTHTSSDISNFNSSVSGLLPTIANSGDNRILTSTGSSVGINAEANLTFDGSTLGIIGNVGAGTSSPTQRLQVHGSSGDDVYLRISNTDTTTASGLLIGLMGTEDAVIRVEPNKALTFGTNNTERMRIGSNGNVTIGEANTSNCRLMIAGTSSNISAARATYEGTLQINENSLSSLQATGGIEFKGSVFGSGYGVKLCGYDNGSFVIGNRANSATWTERFVISQEGSIGIGTSSPSNRFHVQGGELYKTTIDFVFGITGSLVTTYHGVSTGNTYGAIGALSAGGSAWNNLVLQAGGGNVGIGTTSPNTKLQINGQTRVTDGTTNIDFVSSSAVGYIGTQTNHPLVLRTNDTERMRIDGSGNSTFKGRVDITSGTTAGAQTHFYVRPENGALGRDSQITLGCTFSNGWGGADYVARDAGAIRFGANGGSADPRDWSMRFLVANGPAGSDTPRECMRITAAGNVGIGTSTPTFVNANYSGLHIHAATATSLKLTNTTTGQLATDGFELLQDSSANAYIWNRENTFLSFATNSTERMRITAAGNVGIGGAAAATPPELLSVMQDNNGGRTSILIDNLDQRLKMSCYYEGGVGQYSEIQSTNNAETGHQGLILNRQGGNVAIGTATASYRLHVVGNASAANNVVCYLNNTGGTRSRLAFQDTAVTYAPDMGSVGNSLTFDTVGVERVRIGNNGRTQFFAATEKYGVQLNNGSTGNGPFIGSDGADIFCISAAGGAERLRVNAAGELLIGTTTDNGAYLLQVNSQIYATNATIATSDSRFKTNIVSINNATSIIQSLRPVSFDFIPQTDRNFSSDRQIGLIAQEVQEVLSNTDYKDSIVAHCGDHFGLAYEKLVPLLIKALQETNQELQHIKNRLSLLERE